MKRHVRAFGVVCSFLALLTTLKAQDQSKPLTFRAAIELALRNSATTAISQADWDRARATISQSRDVYIPQITTGAALGYSNGFPLSLEGAAPSVFNVNVQGMLFNLAQRDYIRAAKSDAETTAAHNADRRNELIMETALDYIQLDILESSLSVQGEQRDASAKLQDIVEQRVQAGIDSAVDLKRAKLAVARTRLDIAQTHTAADELRLRLSQLTGLPVSAIQTSTESIPELPTVSQEDDLASQAVANNPTVKMAFSIANTKDFKAAAEHRALYPTLDLAGQYAVLAQFNNYAEFFKTFQRNNLSIGGVIRFPVFNRPQRDSANVARFDAYKARQEARNVKEQVSAETLRMQRSVEQLMAARDVAQLEHQIAQADIDTAHAKIESGTATLKDEQNARVAEHEHYTAYLSASFDLDKAQVQLLRQTGALENWALGPKR
jgi:outer membrane protein TolC